MIEIKELKPFLVIYVDLKKYQIGIVRIKCMIFVTVNICTEKKHNTADDISLNNLISNFYNFKIKILHFVDPSLFKKNAHNNIFQGTVEFSLGINLRVINVIL